MLFDDPNDRLITSSELAEYVPGTSAGSWAARRVAGTGPKYIRAGARIYYRLSDVRDWFESNLVDPAEKNGDQ